MNFMPNWAVVFLFFLIFPIAKSENEEVIQALVRFMGALSPPESVQRGVNWGWNVSSDPCTDKWAGVTCDSSSISVRKVILEGYNFTGVLDAGSLCTTTSLIVLSLISSKISGGIPTEIANCTYLTHMFLGANRFSGTLPDSLSHLGNLKRFDVSHNNLVGELPYMGGIGGLLSFLAQNNHLSGQIPNFDFDNLQEFNVAYNNLSGPIPDVDGRFGAGSFVGNPGLCGKPLPNPC